MPRLLALSGSLRVGSSNTELLEAARRLAPDGLLIERYDGIGGLPHFNADLDTDTPPDAVRDLRSRIGEADGLLISCPEYARGIPGSFKNALDWLVGSFEFTNMQVALFNASPRACEAQAALRLVLETMSARLVDEASISVPLLAKGMDAAAIAEEPALSSAIVTALKAFSDAIETGTAIRQSG